MNNLSSFIFDYVCTIDGHIHMFDKTEILTDLYKPLKNTYVCFGDYSIRHIEEYDSKMCDYYDNFIKNYHNSSHILLACAPTIEETIKIFESHEDVIKGFGEIKIHKIYDSSTDYNPLNINDLRRLCKYSSMHNNLPIYIHYTLSNNHYINNLKNTLSKYPKVPIVLCHCGMEEGCNLDNIFYTITKLQKEHSNLWVDVSYDALKYFSHNPLKLSNLCLDRCILGSDLNPQIFHSENIKDPKKFCDNCYIDYEMIKEYIIGSNNNINRLFKL